MTFRAGDTDILIIGAGLSGLACALLLAESGRTVRVAEARTSPGGRIRSVFDPKTGAYLADHGPTWIWPTIQPLISQWVDKLALKTFPQHETGDAILDYGPNAAPAARFLPGQSGIARIVGGPQAIFDQMVGRLPQGIVLTGLPVTSVQVTDTGVVLETRNGDGPALTAEQVIVAVPPRIALDTILWKPRLPDEPARALDAMPTWMAPQAKVVAMYERPFWRTTGLFPR